MKQDDGDQWQYRLDNHAQITAICFQSHPDLHALPSIPPHQIPKSRQSVALSLETLLIHLASSHYWTGRCQIPLDPPPLPLETKFGPLCPIFILHDTDIVLFDGPLWKRTGVNSFLYVVKSPLLQELQVATKYASSFSPEHLFIQQQLLHKYQQGGNAKWEDLVIGGNALTASLMWVEYVRFMKRCVFLDGVIHIHIATRVKGMCFATT